VLRTSAHDFLPAACIFLSSTTTVSVTTKELSNHMIYSGKSSMKVTIELACYAFERVRITQVSPRVQPMPTVTCAQLPTDRPTPRRTFQFRLAAPAWVAHASFDIAHRFDSSRSRALRLRPAVASARGASKIPEADDPKRVAGTHGIRRSSSSLSALAVAAGFALVPAPADCGRQRDGCRTRVASVRMHAIQFRGPVVHTEYSSHPWDHGRSTMGAKLGSDPPCLKQNSQVLCEM
jgi:hypothetical protein